MAVAFLDRLVQGARQSKIVRAGITLLGWDEVAPAIPAPAVLGVTPVLDPVRGGGRLRYFLLQVAGVDPVLGLGADGRPWYKAVFPTVLEYLPRQMRDQTTVLQRSARMLKGLYNADVNLLVIVAGMFGQLGERPLGLVQVYAAQGTAATAEEAIARGSEAFTALLANLRTIPQSRFVPMAEEERDFVARALAGFNHAFVAIGQPDPREQGTRAIGERTAGGKTEARAEETLEQNELIFRGLQRALLDFACVTLAWGIPREAIFRLQQRWREEASIWLSRVQGQKSIVLNFAIPTVFSGMDSAGRSTSYEEGRSHVISAGSAHSEETSVADGYTHGTAHAVGTTVTDTHGQAHTEGESHGSMSSSGGSRTESTGTAQAEGTAHTVGTAHTDGTEHAVSRSSTSGGSSSESHTTGRTETTGVTQINTTTHGESHAQGASDAHGESSQSGWQAGATVGHGSTDGQSATVQRTSSRTSTEGSADTAGGSVSVSGGVPGIASVGATADYHHTWNRSEATGEATAVGSGTQHTNSRQASGTFGLSGETGRSDTHTASTQDTASRSQTVGTNVAHSESVIVDQTTTAHTSMSSSTHGTTDSESHSDTRSESETVSREATASQGLAVSTMWASGATHERSVADTISESHAESRSETDTESQAWSHQEGRSVGDTTSQGVADGESIGVGLARVVTHAGGMSTGVSAGLSLVKSYMWKDATAQAVANLFERGLLLLDEMMLTGAYMSESFWFFSSAEALRAAAGLYALAFHGQTDNVVTPARALVLSPEEVQNVRSWLLSFSPTPHRERSLGVFEGLRFGNMLPMPHLAALVSPAVFEGGRATTTKEAIPPYAVYGPGLLGIASERQDVVNLGQFVSYETGEELDVPYLLTRERMGHFGIFGDSGYGKSEATMHLLQEMNQRWAMPAVVFDWGLNYRKMVRVVPPERFVFHSLYPGGPRPVRWNPLQFIGDVDPEAQMAMTVDVICNAGGLGERQKGFLRDTLRQLYLDEGALTFDVEQLDPAPPEIGIRRRQGAEEEYAARLERSRLGPAEAARLEGEGYALPGPRADGRIYLLDCAEQVRHRVACRRSRPVDFGRWYRALRGLLTAKEGRKQARDVEALQGILNRLGVLAQGRLARMYAALAEDEAPFDITRVMFPDRIAIFEGGTMGETEKAILFGLMIAQIYEAGRVRYRRTLGNGQDVPNFVLAIEEANKVVVNPAQKNNQGATAATADLFSSLARDSRKYGIFLMWLGQSPSAFPLEIVSSCMNFYVFRLKVGPDRQILVEAMAKVAAGLVAPEYLMHLSRLPVGEAVVVLGRSTDEVLLEPSLVRTRMLAGEEPGDTELAGFDPAANS